MGDIKILDYAKYVDDNIKGLYKILKNEKNLDVLPNQNLNYYIANTNRLPEYKENYEYKRSSISVKMEEEFDKDPLRTDNGGIYKYCSYYIISNIYDTSYIDYRGLKAYNVSDTNPVLLKTSDGQEYLFTSITSTSGFTITWDRTKDNIIDDNGDIVRWVKIYSVLPIYDSSASDHRSFMLSLRETASTDDPSICPIKYLIYDSNTTTSCLNGKNNARINLYNAVYLSEVILKNNITEIYALTSSIFSETKYLKYLKNTNTATCNQIGLSSLEYCSLRIRSSSATNPAFNNMYNLKILDLNDSVIDNSVVGFITYGYVLEKLMLNHPITVNISSNSVYVLSNCCNLKTLDLSLFKPLLDSSLLQFNACYNLSNLIIPEDYKYNISLRTMRSLSIETINELISKLHDYSNADVHSLHIPSYLKYELKDDKLLEATNKNWTITFVN